MIKDRPKAVEITAEKQTERKTLKKDSSSDASAAITSETVGTR